MTTEENAMQTLNTDTRSAWTVDSLGANPAWIYALDDSGRRDLTAAVKHAFDPEKTLFDYGRGDFDLGSAWAPIAGALREIKDGTGFAILRGLPRDGLSADEFALLTWAIGLHTGVARPQGKASQYQSAVRNAGVEYRRSEEHTSELQSL